MVKGCMDSSVSSWCVFYLKCDKGKESSSYQFYIKFCYSYILVFLFFYKLKILFIFCSSFRIENALCYKTIVATGR